MEFYLDESGNTGGISQGAFKNNYGGQKIFTLAAIGASNEAEIDRKMSPLLQRYRINAKELKSSKIYKKKPEFFIEIFTLIRDENWPVFIEAVDKKFMLTANVVNSLILPGYCFEAETRETNYIRNVFAEYLYAYMPDDLYIRFLELFTEPSVSQLIDLIDEFIEILKQNRNEVSTALVHSLNVTGDDIKENIYGKSDDISAFLPIPDIGKHGKIIWMLPNLSSFTNIYARINLFMKSNLSDVKIFHDEQLQFDNIIAKSKLDIENITTEKLGFISDTSDYKFKMSADLLFGISHESIGIQVADIIAGFVRRYIEEFKSNQSVCDTTREAHRILMTMNNQKIGLGLNMVASEKDCSKINAF